MGMNHAALIGNLGKDPELRNTSSGRPVTNFSIAVDRKFWRGTDNNRELVRETDWIPVVIWNAPAETCAKFLQKGSRVAVEGSIRPREYTDHNNIHHRTFEIVASRVEFLDKIKTPSTEEVPLQTNNEDIPSMENYEGEEK